MRRRAANGKRDKIGKDFKFSFPFAQEILKKEREIAEVFGNED